MTYSQLYVYIKYDSTQKKSSAKFSKGAVLYEADWDVKYVTHRRDSIWLL